MARTGATIQDVARAAGVSTQTVSNVLNRPERVRPATARKVMRAVDELGYRAHAAARRLRTQRSGMIGLRLDPLATGISGTILDVFLHEIATRANALGLRILLYTAGSPEEEIEALRILVASGDIDGVILTGTSAEDTRPEWLDARKVPYVAFGRPWGSDEGREPHPWVDVDGAAGTRAATQHLLDSGARRIAFLGWQGTSGQGAARRAGWEAAMTEAHPELDLTALSTSAPDAVAPAVEATTALLASAGPIDGIVCASDSLAFGAFLVVGAEIPVIGFDNTAVARAVGLSSLDQRIDLVARDVLDLLVDDGRVVRKQPESRIIEPVLRLRHAVVQDPGSGA